MNHKVDNESVHKTHCCILHGCKYNDPNCPVESGKIEQEFLCELCSYEGFKNLDDMNKAHKILKTISEVKNSFAVDETGHEICEPSSQAVYELITLFCRILVEGKLHENMRLGEVKALADVLCMDIDDINPDLVRRLAYI